MSFALTKTVRWAVFAAVAPFVAATCLMVYYDLTIAPSSAPSWFLIAYVVLSVIAGLVFLLLIPLKPLALKFFVLLAYLVAIPVCVEVYGVVYACVIHQDCL